MLYLLHDTYPDTYSQLNMSLTQYIFITPSSIHLYHPIFNTHPISNTLQPSLCISRLTSLHSQYTHHPISIESHHPHLPISNTLYPPLCTCTLTSPHFQYTHHTISNTHPSLCNPHPLYLHNYWLECTRIYWNILV
jgi:hypothetical protein